MPSPLAMAMSLQGAVNPAQSGIAPTDVVGSYKLASDVAQRNYEAKLAQQNAMFGGLAGLGGAGVMAFGPSAGKSLFGTPALPRPGDPATPGLLSGLFGGGGAAGGTGTVPAATSALFAPTDAELAGLGGSVATDMAPVAAAGTGAAAGGGMLADIGSGLAALFPFLV